MSHKSVRELIETSARKLGDDIQFTYARPSDFNILRDKSYPFIALDPLISIPSFPVNGVSNYTKAWSGQLAFYQLDKESSDQEEYKLILDFMDELVDRFIINLNTYSYGKNINSDNIILSFGNQQPFIKATADILTGWILPITIQVSGQFDYCADGC